ncbi:protease [Vibrio azureus]|uniref:Peptidase S8 family protein n=1 Tax=Vibrio azureus NBRC 104587 TaxID=1219077 RepID=U3BZK0_9VIBR|nr:S8 family peptidase [Vibrio azureus]AUI87768.1 protease [Vibrio azureus]GAD74719.1 peptidase S8 family protein [Vibrio azureus NBRC 104587]
MKKTLRLSVINIAMLASSHALAAYTTGHTDSPYGANSPYITNVKGTIVEDYSIKATPKPVYSFLRFLTPPLESQQDWFNLSPITSNVQGVGANFVYDALLPPRIPKTIVVAVLDSGVDIEHEDLKNKLWTNTKEIPDNGLDDDNNGYIDDVHGWNFLGNQHGQNVNQDTLEVTREYKKYLDILAEQQWLDDEQQAYYKKIEQNYLEAVESNRSALERVEQATGLARSLQQQILNVILHDDFSVDGLTPLLQHDSPQVAKAAKDLIELFDTWYSFKYLDSRYNRYLEALQYHYNVNFDTRQMIVQDDISNPWEKGYGNNLVKGPSGRHGTHVAGIIAAERGNGIGIDGIAENVEIMSVRVVPNGDERDKDIANAVRYAVDNGANIINMSFGKSYSPRKFVVDHAFRYAAKKGVLIVHSAGNSKSDNDLKPSFPNRFAQHAWSQPIETWMDVGASAKYADEKLVARFSNFGQTSVDIFAPGYRILSTTPDNTYESLSGTSMAAPVVSGVAALVWSHHPDLTATELKSVLMDQARPYADLLVKKPSSPEQLVPFETLSISGGIVDAEAIFSSLSEQP